MENGYDKGIDLYYRNVTNHYHCKNSPHSQLPDHKIPDNLQIFLSFVYPNKDAQTVTPPAHCQTAFQKNHARNVPSNLQMRQQLLHLRSQNLKPDSFQVFKTNIIVFSNRIKKNNF